jgi:hypothetical protein
MTILPVSAGLFVFICDDQEKYHGSVNPRKVIPFDKKRIWVTASLSVHQSPHTPPAARLPVFRTWVSQPYKGLEI